MFLRKFFKYSLLMAAVAFASCNDENKEAVEDSMTQTNAEAAEELPEGSEILGYIGQSSTSKNSLKYVSLRPYAIVPYDHSGTYENVWDKYKTYKEQGMIYFKDVRVYSSNTQDAPDPVVVDEKTNTPYFQLTTNLSTTAGVYNYLYVGLTSDLSYAIRGLVTFTSTDSHYNTYAQRWGNYMSLTLGKNLYTNTGFLPTNNYSNSGIYSYMALLMNCKNTPISNIMVVAFDDGVSAPKYLKADYETYSRISILNPTLDNYNNPDNNTGRRIWLYTAWYIED